MINDEYDFGVKFCFFLKQTTEKNIKNPFTGQICDEQNFIPVLLKCSTFKKDVIESYSFDKNVKSQLKGLVELSNRLVDCLKVDDLNKDDLNKGYINKGYITTNASGSSCNKEFSDKSKKYFDDFIENDNKIPEGFGEDNDKVVEIMHSIINFTVEESKKKQAESVTKESGYKRNLPFSGADGYVKRAKVAASKLGAIGVFSP